MRSHLWPAAPASSSVPRCCDSFLPVARPSTENRSHRGKLSALRTSDFCSKALTVLPGGLWREPCVWRRWAEGCSHGWGRRSPGRESRTTLISTRAVSRADVVTASLYLSCLRDFSRGRLLLLWLLLLSGLVQIPLPCKHGFDGLFDWPAVNLFVLPEETVMRREDGF